MATWKLLTCAVQGESFIVGNEVEWPHPDAPTTTLALDLEMPDGSRQNVNFPLTMDGSGSRLACAQSDPPGFLMSLVWTPDYDGKSYLSGGVIRQNLTGEDDDVESATAVTDPPPPARRRWFRWW